MFTLHILSYPILLASKNSDSRKEQEAGGTAARSSSPIEGLLGVLFATVRRAYAPVSVPSRESAREREDDRVNSEFASIRDRQHSQGSLVPGCDEGFGGGLLDLCLAEQCSSLIRELYEVGLCSCLYIADRFPDGIEHIDVVLAMLHWRRPEEVCNLNFQGFQ